MKKVSTTSAARKGLARRAAIATGAATVAATAIPALPTSAGATLKDARIAALFDEMTDWHCQSKSA